MALQIITNNHWRQFIYGHMLTEKEKADFDYMDKDEIDYTNFFRYRGRVYSINDFMILRNDEHGPFKTSEWDGYHGDSVFSGVLIKLSECGEGYKVATYIS